MLGAVIDRLADFFLSLLPLKFLVEKIGRSSAARDTENESKRMKLYVAEKHAGEFLDYLRSQVRILRSAVLNFSIIAFFSTILTFQNYGASTGLIVCIVVIFIFSVIFSVYAIAETAFRRFLNQTITYLPK